MADRVDRDGQREKERARRHEVRGCTEWGGSGVSNGHEAARCGHESEHEPDPGDVDEPVGARELAHAKDIDEKFGAWSRGSPVVGAFRARVVGDHRALHSARRLPVASEKAPARALYQFLQHRARDECELLPERDRDTTRQRVEVTGRELVANRGVDAASRSRGERCAEGQRVKPGVGRAIVLLG